MTEQQLAAMKLALEALEEVKSWKSPTRWDGCFDEEIDAIRTAIEQAERQQALDKKAENARELGLDYEPVQEPFVWLEDDKGNKYEMPEANKGPLLKRAEEAFESAKQREWVGLTDEEMHACWDSPLTPLGMKHVRAIEAKLREKNT